MKCEEEISIQSEGFTTEINSYFKFKKYFMGIGHSCVDMKNGVRFPANKMHIPLFTLCVHTVIWSINNLISVISFMSINGRRIYLG